MDILRGDNGAFHFGLFLLDPVRRRLLHDGATLKLPPKQFETLAYLVENAGRVVSKDELMSAVWPGRIVEEGSLSQTIFLVRRALEQASGEHCIVTAPGQGYRFAVPVRQSAENPAAPVAPGADVTTIDVREPATSEWAGLWWRAGWTSGWRVGWAAWGALALLLIAAAGFSLMNRSQRNSVVPPPHSIAVLPFANTSGDASQDYFSDGISEELIDALARVNALKVAARMSSFSFKARHITVESIGRQLKVGTVLDGSVRRDGQHVRISVRLIDTMTGYQLWSQSFARDMSDVLTMQDDIVAAVLRVMKLSVSAGETGYSAVGGTRNAQAYDAELHAEKLMDSKSETSFRAALAAFDDALRADPTYADAHAGRSRALAGIAAMWEEMDSKKINAELDEALREADTAVELAPNSAIAHLARGSVLGLRLDISNTYAEMSIAHDLNPGNAVVERGYASVQSSLGHAAEAESAIRHVIELDPLTAANYGRQAVIFYLDRKYGEALLALRREEAIGSDDPDQIRMLRAVVHLAQGRPEAVLNDCTPSCGSTNQWLAIAAKKLGRDAEAQAHFADVAKESGAYVASSYATIYAQWDDRAVALHWLKIAVDQHDPSLQAIKVDPLFDPIRHTPEFDAIERQLNLPP